MDRIKNFSDALNWSKSYLKQSKVSDPDLSAEILLSEACGLSRLQIFSNIDQKLTVMQKEKFLSFINRRKNHEPIQYIIGYSYFRNLKIKVGPGVLIPRPETEYFIELTLKKIKNDNIKILDLCTGSACIALSLTEELNHSNAVAIENSKKALYWANLNINSLNLKDRIILRNDDILKNHNYGKNFDLIISNPPYVPDNVIQTLNSQVKDFEPISALRGGSKGLDYIDSILQISKNCMSHNGLLALELFEDSIFEASQIFKDNGFCCVEIVKDLADKPRYLFVKTF